MSETDREQATARRARPALAAILSFVWPGVGQAYRGRRRLAWIFGLPPALAVVGLLAVILVISPLVFAVHLLSPSVSLSLLVLVVALGVWRSVSILEAVRPGGRASAALAMLLIGLVALSHAWLANNAWAFYQAGQLIHEPIAQDTHPSPEPTDAGVTPAPGASPNMSAGPPTPAPSPLPGEARRVTVLLIGVDNTHGPELGLTDTLIVASFDPVSHSLAMISLPRDTGRLPYYGGGQYGPRINTLMQSATRNPDQYPDGPMGTLVNEMSYLVGIPIDYYARIDIAGFRTLVDAVGGIDVVVETAINDPGYGFSPTEIGFYLEPGAYHLDGKLATAYARSRHGSSDYQRARRQQQILLALRNRLRDPGVLTNLPAVLSAVSQIVRTDAPLERLPEIVTIALNTSDAATRHVVLSPPRYAHHAFSPAGLPTSMTELTMDAVAELSIELFGDASRYAPPPP